MSSIKNLINRLLFASLLACGLVGNIAFAAFPDDFSGVNWIDPNISSWSKTSSLDVAVNGSVTRFTHSKQAVWPNTNHSIVGRCCNASVWAIIKRNGQWYATTFEYLRPNTPTKSTSAFDGTHIKRPPFKAGSFNWRPANGEVYGFMVSGFARFNLNDVNIEERSNVFFYKWGSGPSNAAEAKTFEEVPRNPDGTPNYGPPTPPPPPPPPPPPVIEECVAPEPPAPVVNTHLYTGLATGTATVTGSANEVLDFEDEVQISVSDDRSLTFTIDEESFTATVAADGSFSGVYTFNILGQCPVDIVVNGVISGNTATGSSSGEDSCLVGVLPFNAVFSATFSANSPSAPSYLDERGPLPAPFNPCLANKIIPVISTLLLED